MSILLYSTSTKIFLLRGLTSFQLPWRHFRKDLLCILSIFLVVRHSRKLVQCRWIPVNTNRYMESSMLCDCSIVPLDTNALDIAHSSRPFLLRLVLALKHLLCPLLDYGTLVWRRPTASDPGHIFHLSSTLWCPNIPTAMVDTLRMAEFIAISYRIHTSPDARYELAWPTWLDASGSTAEFCPVYHNRGLVVAGRTYCCDVLTGPFQVTQCQHELSC